MHTPLAPPPRLNNLASAHKPIATNRHAIPSPDLGRLLAGASRLRNTVNQWVGAAAYDERLTPRVRRARHDWITHRMPLMRRVPERLVFIDETIVKTNLTRLRGRSMRGTQLTGSAPLGKWGTQTLIAGLTQDGLVAPWVIKGAMDGDAFAAYVRKVIVPDLQPGTCVILGNLSTHHTQLQQQNG